jgi:hypothetical protein
MLCWALDNNLSRQLIKKSDIKPSKIAMLKFLIEGIILFGLLMATQPVTHVIDGLVNIDKTEWLAISILTVFGFAAALFFLLEGLKRIGTMQQLRLI